LGLRDLWACDVNLLDHCCFAWNKLIDMPWKIMSVGMRDWAQWKLVLVLGAALGFHFLGRGFLGVSGATGVAASLSAVGELFGGTVPEGPGSNAFDG
jgi:hypothetical protein